MEKDQRTYLIKRLLYKSNYRGCKETDLLLGNFAKNYIYSMSDEELLTFEILLGQIDNDIWDWVNNNAKIPDHISKDLINKISSSIK